MTTIAEVQARLAVIADGAKKDLQQIAKVSKQYREEMEAANKAAKKAATDRSLSDIKKQLEGVAEAAGDADDSSNDLGDTLAGLKTRLDAAGLAAAVWEVTNALVAATKEAAKIERVRGVFNALGGDLSRVREQTRGLLSDFDAMNAFNATALKFGEGAADEGMAGAFELAQARATALGTTIAEEMKAISTASADTAQKLMADVGVYIDMRDAVQEWADEHDVLVASLSESEQRTIALTTAVNEAGTSLNRLDSQTQDAQGALESMSTWSSDLADSLKSAFLDDIEDILKGIDRVGKGLKDAGNEGSPALEKLNGFLGKTVTLLNWLVVAPLMVNWEALKAIGRGDDEKLKRFIAPTMQSMGLDPRTALGMQSSMPEEEDPNQKRAVEYGKAALSGLNVLNNAALDDILKGGDKYLIGPGGESQRRFTMSGVRYLTPEEVAKKKAAEKAQEEAEKEAEKAAKKAAREWEAVARMAEKWEKAQAKKIDEQWAALELSRVPGRISPTQAGSTTMPLPGEKAARNALPDAFDTEFGEEVKANAVARAASRLDRDASPDDTNMSIMGRFIGAEIAKALGVESGMGGIGRQGSVVEWAEAGAAALGNFGDVLSEGAGIVQNGAATLAENMMLGSRWGSTISGILMDPLMGTANALMGIIFSAENTEDALKVMEHSFGKLASNDELRDAFLAGAGLFDMLAEALKPLLEVLLGNATVGSILFEVFKTLALGVMGVANFMGHLKAGFLHLWEILLWMVNFGRETDAVLEAREKRIEAQNAVAEGERKYQELADTNHDEALARGRRVLDQLDTEAEARSRLTDTILNAPSGYYATTPLGGAVLGREQEERIRNGDIHVNGDIWITVDQIDDIKRFGELVKDTLDDLGLSGITPNIRPPFATGGS